jgi:cytosine/adenosine deaminase-related metal-dependent hydrolase
MAISLQARVVFPVAAPPIEHGVVTIDRDRITAVGTKAVGGQIQDLGHVALMPAWVNAHTHLEFSDLSEPLGWPAVPLVDWIRFVISHRAARASPPASAIASGLQESIAAGVAIVGEIATEARNGEAAKQSQPEPYSLLPAPRSLLFQEVIGFSRARAASALLVAEQRLDAVQRAPDDRIRFGLSPHAPYTVSPKLLQQVVLLAQRRHLPVAMHLAESVEELQLLAEGSGPFRELLEERSMWDAAAVSRGSRPLDYLRTLADAPRAVVIHGNYLNALEREFLAQHADHMSLVYCPRTHAYFHHAPYPLSEAIEVGVRVALGTDSRASNPDLDMLAELRHVAREHPQLSPVAILQMGTLAGAEALGWEKEVGSLTPGKSADLVAVPLPGGISGGPAECLAAVLHSAERPSAVWLRGRKCVPTAGERATTS